MGETEVTQGLWEEVWGPTWPGAPYDVPSADYGLGANYPAYYVNWDDAVVFCNLLTVADTSISDSERVYYSDSKLETPYNKTNAVNGDSVYVDWSKTGYRLPTEAEWEYAARYIDGTSWNNGDHVSGDTEYACYDPGSGPLSGSPLASDSRLSEYTWWHGNNSGSPGDSTYGIKEVGHKTENALGLYDMSGNVCEWVYDLYFPYSGSFETDPIVSMGLYLMIRGGYFYDERDSLCCASRAILTTDGSKRRFYIGFRLCRQAE